MTRGIQKDLDAALAEGGLRAYCYLQTAWKFAMCSRDFVFAAKLDRLIDRLDQKTAREIMEVA